MKRIFTRSNNIYGFRTNAVPYYRRSQIERWRRFNKIRLEYILPSVKTLTFLVVFFGLVLAACILVDANWGASAEHYGNPWEITIPENTFGYDRENWTMVTASKLRVRVAPDIDSECVDKLKYATMVYRIAYCNGWVLVSVWPSTVPYGWVSPQYLNGGSNFRNANTPYGGNQQ